MKMRDKLWFFLFLGTLITIMHMDVLTTSNHLNVVRNQVY